MTPEQKLVIAKRQYLIGLALSSVGVIAAQYVVRKQEKELDKIRKAFRAMHDVASLYEAHVPSDILARGNEMLEFARIEIKYDE